MIRMKINPDIVTMRCNTDVPRYFIFLDGIVFNVRGNMFCDTTVSVSIRYFHSITKQAHRYGIDC